MQIFLLLLFLSFTTPSLAINHEDEDGNITTPNILDNSGVISSDDWTGDDIQGRSSGRGQINNSTNEYRTGWLGGTIVSDKAYFSDEMTIDEWQAGFELDYGVKVWSHSSNLSVPLCENTSYDCKDSFTVKVALGDGSETVQTFTHNEVQAYSGWKDFNYSQTIAANDFQNLWAQMSLYGIDAGYVAGMYGPRFDDPFITATYSEQTPVEIQVLEQYLTQQLLVNTPNNNTMDDDFFNQVVSDVMESEEVMTMEAAGDYQDIDISVNITDAAGAEIVNLDMNIDSIDSVGTMYVTSVDSAGDMETMEINIAEEMQQIQMDSAPAAPEPEVSTETESAPMETTTTESDPQMEPETQEMEAEPETEMTMAAADNESEPEPEAEAEAEPEVAQAQEEEEEQEAESESEEQEEETQQASAKSSIKAKLVAAVVQQVISRVTDQGGDVEGTRLLMMNMMGGDLKFQSYQQAQLPDAIFYESETPYEVALIDPLSSVYSLGSDIMMNEMIDSQYNFEK